MLETGLKKYAQELGFSVLYDFGYGEYNGYILTLKEGAGWKSAAFAVVFPDDTAKSAIQAVLFDPAFQSENIISEVNITDATVEMRFRDAVDTIDKMKNALELVSAKLHETGVLGVGYCNKCKTHFEETEGEDVYITGNVFRMHSGCIDSLGAAMKENAEQAKNKGNLGAGIAGAAIGALVGAIPWAVASYFGWFVAFLGFVVGIASKKGYELLKGKESKAKPISVLVFSLIAVIIAEIAVYLISIMGMSADEGMALSLSQAFQLFFYVIKVDPSLLGSVIFDLVLSWVFVILGIFPMLKATFAGATAAAPAPVRLGRK